MQVNGINHVNIVADDIEKTVRFYEDLLGFRAETPPMVRPGFQGRWLCDAQGCAIIHLMGYSEERHAGRTLGPQTGSIDHVALACSGFAGMKQRCEDRAIEHRINDRKFGDLRQIFVTDPNDVVLELNFAGE